jgi:hypothetical protein
MQVIKGGSMPADPDEPKLAKASLPAGGNEAARETGQPFRYPV